MLRLTKEIGELQKANDLSLAVGCQDADVRHVKALIVGPPDTPYENGYFEFDMKFGREYPAKAPAVTAITTNGGRTRFNPNIYATGKVCLSILGTWRGERGEEWSSAQGLESILISIQSLMSSNPFENEPGFEKCKTDKDKDLMQQYVKKIRHETLRISVIQRLEDYLDIFPDGTPKLVKAKIDEDEEEDEDEDVKVEPPFEPFKDMIKRKFMWYYDSYLESIEEESKNVTRNQMFKSMPFEHGSNSMEGKFNYPELEARLRRIRTLLDKEAERWVEEGVVATKNDESVAVNLRRQFDQCVSHFQKEGVALDIELEDDNPFHWRVSYFGKPMSNLDGGLFNIQIIFSTQFPDEQPRVKLLTPLFHYKITKDGIPCYFPRRAEDVRSHIEAIIAVLQEEQPPYDPRMQVNKEAAKLFWGSEEDKKAYKKRFRRDVQRSMEG